MHHVPAVPPVLSATPDVVGIVTEIRRFPLKSAAGQTMTTASLDAHGVVGDRAWVVRGPDGAVLRPRDCPALAGLSADDVHLDEDALARRTGVAGAHVTPADAQHAPRAALHLVGADAADDPSAPPGADPGRRANIVIAGCAGAVLAPGAERGWVGLTVLVGTARLAITRLPGHCLGVYAAVVVDGDVSVGDPVRLVVPPRP